MKTADLRKILEKASFGPLNDFGMVISVDSIPYIIRKIKQLEKESAQQSTKEITDEEIEKASEAYHVIHGGYHPDFGKGAKWLRDKQKANLREELIAYAKFKGLKPYLRKK